MARRKADHWRGLAAKLSVAWKNVSTTASEDDWCIKGWHNKGWHNKELSSVASDDLWFQESLDEALSRPRDVVALSRSRALALSRHEETSKSRGIAK